MAVLELAGVVKEYPGPPSVTALYGIDLQVADGEWVATDLAGGSRTNAVDPWSHELRPGQILTLRRVD